VDPYRGLHSRDAEWVPQRQWVYRTDVTIPATWDGRRAFLVFDGVDHDAEVFLDGEPLGGVTSLFAPTTFEITGASGTRSLTLVLHEAPAEQSQIGRTSKVTTRKPRMGYGWDFGPRLVHLGIWGDVHLVSTGAARIADLWVRSTLQEAGPARTTVVVTLADAAATATRVTVAIDRDGGAPLGASAEVAPGEREAVLDLTIEDPALWWPNGMGEQPLYRCRATVETDGAESDLATTTFGIRTVELRHNEGPDGPRADALPYTFEVNGKRLYAKGWNWVPVDAMYGRGDLSERYSELIELAREAHVNLLRVWGGGLIERELFYELCDSAGILVWQEFVQSSSGLDNEPPVEPTFLATLAAEAEAIVRTRRNHPSLAAWCGGNELATGAGAVDPLTLDHPNVAALWDVVRRTDPGRPFLPTSPSGPVFYLVPEVIEERPLDLHDVHGPWDYTGPVRSYALYDSSTALLHSEFGTQGAISRTSLTRFVDPEARWPPDDTNPTWVHHGSWWQHRYWVEKVFGKVEDLEEYIALSQWMQSDLLAYALDANRRRWPVCSGSLPWQLNEPWPNTHCTSVVDYYLRPKLAYWGVRAAYAPVASSLRHGGLALDGERLRASVHVCSDEATSGDVLLTCHQLDGSVVHERTLAYDGAGSLEIGSLDLDLDALDTEILLVRLAMGDRSGGPARHYVFSQRGEGDEPLRPMLRAPVTQLSVQPSPDGLTVRNDGRGVALFPLLDVDDDRVCWRASDNGPVILPGETWKVGLTLRARTQAIGPHAPDAPKFADLPAVVDVDLRGWNIQPHTLPLALSPPTARNTP